MTVSLARELAGTGVTANTVAPGAILTEPVRDMATQVAAERGWGQAWDDIEAAAVSQWFPNDIGRFGRPEEIAAAVVFLASKHAGGGAVRNVA
jgi:NAD(P)-dependent dehydrogenase (short-subunit alcohol dehydrogenase family)